jgi:hypothetical protein
VEAVATDVDGRPVGPYDRTLHLPLGTMFVLDSIPRPTVLLDANAVRYCFGRDGFTEAQLNELRATIRELANQDLIRPIVTLPVLWELTAVYLKEGAASHEATLGFLLAIGSKRFLKNEYERMKLELRLGRKLRHSEVFDECDPVATLAMYTDAKRVAADRDMQRKHKDDERAKEAAKRVDVVAALEGQDAGWKAKLRADASARWTRAVRGFARLEMRKAARELGIRIAPNSWPRPDDLPTLWFGESFYVAKVLFVLIDTEKELTSKKSLQAMPDLLDATHFRDAAYADVLVTQDENFRRVAEMAKTGVKLVSFDEFAQALLAVAPTLGAPSPS